MRESISAVAWICHPRQVPPAWLVRWNAKWKRYSLVGGHKNPGETFLECLLRELAEELRIHPESDFSVLPQSRIHLEFTGWSESAQAETAYTIEIFEVRLNDDVAERIADDAHTRWVTEAEIRGRRCEDGRPVSDLVERVWNAMHSSS